MSTSKLTLALAGALLAFLPVACKSTETATNANAATCCKDGNGKAECCKDGQGECCKEKKAGTMNVAAPAPKSHCEGEKGECPAMKGECPAMQADGEKKCEEAAKP